MTTEAILAAAANFRNCLEGLWPEAARRGVTRATFDTYTRGLTPDLRIMDLMDTQPEFTKAFWDYLDLLVSDNRIKRGREILAQYRADLRCGGEGLRGRPPHRRRDLGRSKRISAPRAATARWSARPRRSPVSAAGRPISATNFSPRWKSSTAATSIPTGSSGSWAGAFGPTQFMPTSFKRYAVDFDGDGRRDVVDSVPDLIASTANNLKMDGWVPGQTWGYEVVVPAELQLSARRQRQGDAGPATGSSSGVTRVGGKPFPAPGRPRLPVGAGRRAGAGLPDARTTSASYEVQSGRSLCAGDRPSRRPAARRRAVRHRLAAPRAGAHRAPSAGDAAASGAPRLRIGGEPNGRIGAKSRARSATSRPQGRPVPDGFATADMLDRLRQH